MIHEDDCTQVINEHPATIFAGKVSGRLSSMELFFGDAVKMLACDFGIRSANDKLLSLVLSVTDFLFLHPSLQPPDTVDVPRIYLHRGASRTQEPKLSGKWMRLLILLHMNEATIRCSIHNFVFAL